MIQVLRPFSTHPSPRRSARVCMPKMSEPASGSLAPLAPNKRPSQSPRKYRLFWASVPKARIGIVTVQSEALIAKINPLSGQP